MTIIPKSHIELLEGPYLAVFTTVAPDGQPESTVVWCSWDGSHVLVNALDNRRKVQNVTQNPLVSLTVLDPQDPYHWIDVRGCVEEMVPDVGYANINAHSKLYTGNAEYYSSDELLKRKGQDKRVILRILPTRVVTM